MAVDEKALSFLLKETPQMDFVMKVLDLAADRNYEALDTLQSQMDVWKTTAFQDTMDKGVRKGYLQAAFATAVQQDLLSKPKVTPDAAMLTRLEKIGHDAAADLVKKLVTSFSRHTAKKDIYAAMLKGAESAQVRDNGSNFGVFLGEMNKGDKEKILKTAIARSL